MADEWEMDFPAFEREFARILGPGDEQQPAAPMGVRLGSTTIFCPFAAELVEFLRSVPSDVGESGLWSHARQFARAKGVDVPAIPGSSEVGA
jgi:hypothetical protein